MLALDLCIIFSGLRGSITFALFMTNNTKQTGSKSFSVDSVLIRFINTDSQLVSITLIYRWTLQTNM